MRDARKFCRPKITKNPKLGDVYIKLKCGQTAPISAEEYNKIKKYFKVDSVVGSSPSIGGNLIVKSKLLGVLTVISPEDFDPDIFEILEVIGEKVAGYEYVDLGLPSGTLWAAMNVGASSETDYGNYYMYGMGSKTYDSTDTPYAGTEDPLAASADTAAQVWGGDWHMPTRAQMQELIANTTYQWVTNYKGSGINGGTFTATNGAVLFLPAAGFWSDGSQYSVGNSGFYWGSSPDGSGSAYLLSFNSGSKIVLNDRRKYGFSVRGVKDPSSEDNKPLAEIGDVLVHNTILNIDSILSFNDWINANDSWEITGLYGIETFEEEDAQSGYNVIMANGTTLIIKPEDYSKVSNNWEIVDTIEKETGLVAKFNVTNTSSSIQLCKSSVVNQFSEIEIDGVVQPSVVRAYTFSTLGEHTVKYTLTDPTTIGESAFNDCGKLISMTIPNSVTSIGSNAFQGCTSLTSITFGNSLTSIGGNAFSNCTSLTSVYITDVAAWCNISFANYYSNPLRYAHHLYMNGSEITDLVIPNSVTSIGDWTFGWCTSLTSITIPNSVTSIGWNAFNSCSGLTSVTIPNSVTNIGESAFQGCSGLTSVIIGNSVTNIGLSAFFNCTSLTSVTISNSVTIIGDYAFRNCQLDSIISNATIAPTITNSTFQGVKTGGTLTVPQGSTGYDTWMICLSDWTKVEQ